MQIRFMGYDDDTLLKMGDTCYHSCCCCMMDEGMACTAPVISSNVDDEHG